MRRPVKNATSGQRVSLEAAEPWYSPVPIQGSMIDRCVDQALALTYVANTNYGNYTRKQRCNLLAILYDFQEATTTVYPALSGQPVW